MTESLLQQARQLIVEIEMMREMHDFSDPTYTKLHTFLESVIEHLEISCPNLARLGTLTPTGQLERTHTLAIMAAVLLGTGHPDVTSSLAIDVAGNILAEVEKRNP